MESETRESESNVSLKKCVGNEKDIKVESPVNSISSVEKSLETSESKQAMNTCSEVGDDTFFDEDNTQIISGDEHCQIIAESTIPLKCKLQGLDVVKEVPDKIQILETQEIKDKQHHDFGDEEKTCEGLNQTLVIESEEEMKNRMETTDDVLVKHTSHNGVNEKDESKDGDEINYIDNMNQETKLEIKNTGENSQALILDIRDGDGKIPHSPGDLFASQSIENETEGNTIIKEMDSEDIIPSSLASESENVGKEEIEETKISNPLKRKITEDEEENKIKIRRQELHSITSDLEISKKHLPEECNSDVEILVNNISKETSNASEALSVPDKNFDTVTEVNEGFLRNGGKGDIKTFDLRDEKQGKYSESSEDISKEPRKSVEIIYTCFKKPDNLQPFVKSGQNLATVPEENGEKNEEIEEEPLHLHISMSPSQMTQSFSEAEVSKDEEECLSTSDSREKNCRSDKTDSCNSSHVSHDQKYNSDCNSHSSVEADSKIVDTITVDDNNDFDISSLDKKISSNVLNTVKICPPPGSGNDSDVTVLLESDNSFSSENTKHRAKNGITLKRKHIETENEEKLVILDEADQTESATKLDACKHSRIADKSSEQSTPDFPSLLPPKGSSTPSVLNRTFVVQTRLHLKDVHQVNFIEMVQCQNIEDFLSMKLLHQNESSDGSAADESKNSSPSSVMSLGPFTLKSQRYRMSSSSTSTSSSGHSNIGFKSKSDDGLFAAPNKRAPVCNNRFQNVHVTPDFERDLFELAEKSLYETESKLLSSIVASVIAKNATPSVSTSIHSLPVALDGIKDLEVANSEFKNTTELANTETQKPIVETPKSTKKCSRGNRNSRDNGRTAMTKIMKEITAQENVPQQTLNQEIPKAGENSGSQRKQRKAPTRSSKRAGGNTPSTPVSLEESKTITPTAPSSGRSRRNRNQNQLDSIQPEKTDSSSESSHVYDWNSEGCFTKLVADAPVFARWTDKKYYPGRIKEKMKDGRWIIEFDDKTVRPLKEEFIIPINILTKGQVVFAHDGDEYEQGMIMEFKLKDGEVQYGVDLGSGKKVFVPRSRLFMSEDQARLLQENMDPKSPTTSSPALSNVSCDNIVHHKRPRSTRVLFGSASPSVSGVMKSAKRPSHDNSCSSSVSDSNDKGQTLMLDEIIGVDPEVPSSFPDLLRTPSGRGKGPGRIKSKSRSCRRNMSANHAIGDNQEYNELDEMLGPIPVKGSKMFSGKCFLLTHSGIRALDVSKATIPLKSSKKSVKTSDSSEEVSSDEGFNSKIPFVKDHLKQQLEAGGGIVYENFEDVPEEQFPNCFLIADRPSLTAKYILCLANNIKIIHHPWVIELSKGMNISITSGRLVAGWDLEGQSYVASDAIIRTRKQKPLNKKEIGIVNESQTFVKFWERILELLGASVRHISPGSPEQDQQFSGVDVILTDNTCPPEVQERAREWSIPLVSTVWVTQTLINWRIRSYNGHPHYRYDYCSSD